MPAPLPSPSARRSKDRPLILGVTGGIACGKSRVVSEFSRLGAAVVSADQLAREIVQPGMPALSAIAAGFGREVLLPDGTLNRQRLGEIVFADSAARQRLNRITHPAIAELAQQRFAELAAGRPPLIVYEAPLLFEAGAEKRVDLVLVVSADPDVQLQRLMQRDQLDAAAARQRIAAQMPLADKCARADLLLDNSGPESDIAGKVSEIFSRLIG